MRSSRLQSVFTPGLVLAVLAGVGVPDQARAGGATGIRASVQRGASRLDQARRQGSKRLHRQIDAKRPSIRRTVWKGTSFGRRVIRGPDRRTGARNARQVASRQRALSKILIDSGVTPEQLPEVLEHVSLGMPSRASTRNPEDLVVAQPGYVSSYNRDRKGPNWVAAKITRSDVTGRHKKRLGFKRNTKIPDEWEPASQNDYKGQFKARTITRGHLIGSGDQTGDSESHRDTYFLQTNIVPQIYENNAGPWHDFEVYLRNQARARKDVYVFAGGVYGRRPPTIGKHKVAVPKATWKVAVVVEPGQSFDSPSTRVMYLVVPNEVGKVHLNQTFESFLVGGHEVERMTGLRFFTSQPEAVRRQLVEQRHRPEVPIHYFSRRKLAEIRKMGLAVPSNVRMDPADLTLGERVGLLARRAASAIGRVFKLKAADERVFRSAR